MLPKTRSYPQREIEALVERAGESGFDDGEFGAHDFSGGQSLSMSKWTGLNQLVEKHAEAMQGILSSEFGVQIAVAAEESRFGIKDNLYGVPGATLPCKHPTEPLMLSCTSFARVNY